MSDDDNGFISDGGFEYAPYTDSAVYTLNAETLVDEMESELNEYGLPLFYTNEQGDHFMNTEALSPIILAARESAAEFLIDNTSVSHQFLIVGHILSALQRRSQGSSWVDQAIDGMNPEA